MEEKYGKIAEIIVDGLNVKEGEYILISGGAHQYELLAKVAVNVAKKGGIYRISVSSDELNKRILMECSDEYLDREVTAHDKYMAGLYDAAISINGTLDEGIYRDIPPEKMKLGVKSSMILNDIAKSSRRRSIYMAWPTKQKAESCNMKYEEFEKLYIDALMVDREEMMELAVRIKDVIKKGGICHINSEKGSDLTFELSTERRSMIDTGSFTEEMVNEGDITKNLPCGEVYTTPVESTVEGVAIFDLVFADGKPVKDLILEFKNGKLVKSSAREGIEFFRKRYDNAVGDKDKLGELGIGINPVMRKPIGHTLLDEKIYGSIHLALGENRMYGGVNQSSMHWDLVMLQPTLKIGDTTIIEKGKYF